MRKPFDLLREASRFGADQGIRLGDPAMRTAFGLHVDDALTRALDDPTLLQGQRAEAMFEAMVASFGHVRFIKQEDVGPFQSSERLIAPDYRVVLEDGTNWLVEVKNVYLQNAFSQRRRLLDRSYRRALEGYATATGGILKIAVFWARWSIWTLIDPAQIAPGDRELTIDMMTAFKANEMAALGDQMLGLKAPVRLRLTMDPERTSAIGDDGMVMCVIGNARLFCGDVELHHPADQQIAWTVLQYSDWESRGPNAVVDGRRLDAIEFESGPDEPSGQGFDMAGSLSRMFARYFAERTMADGKVVDIRAPVQAEWFGALRSHDGYGRMPTWRFLQEPNYDFLLEGEVSPSGASQTPDIAMRASTRQDR